VTFVGHPPVVSVIEFPVKFHEPVVSAIEFPVKFHEISA
jgi:hypothetical protein